MDRIACLSDRDVVTSSVAESAMFSFAKGYMPYELRYVGDNGKFDVNKISITKRFVCSDANRFLGVKHQSYLMDCFLLAKYSVFFDCGNFTGSGATRRIYSLG